MISLKNKQSGFTIIELLIVIVVIGILAALVITTFSGIQERARDTERETDVKQVASHLEAFYVLDDHSYYPSLDQLDDDSFATSDLKGLDLEALRAPGATANSIVGADAAIGNYLYVPTPANCDNSTTNCTGFTLTATKEGGGTYEKSALN